MDLGLAEARVLVSGGASNIGRAIVLGFAREGARIMLCDIDQRQAEKVASEARGLGAAGVAVAVADLAVAGAGRQVVERMTATWGGVDVLVNNVGWTKPEFLLADSDRKRWQRVVDLNLFAAVEMTQQALEVMCSAGGSIVFIASDAAFGQARQAIYGAAKAGLIALARTIAKEHGRDGVRANVIAPGLVLPDVGAVGDNSMWARGVAEMFDDRQLTSVLKATPLRRLTQAEDVAHAVVWLSSERAARQVTGQVISVSGGFAMP